MKKLYVIAGTNGAGKTTASYTVLPEKFDCKEFVNAGEIARGISPFNPESVFIPPHRRKSSRPALRIGKTWAWPKPPNFPNPKFYY